MKAAANGALNLSVLDGWWDEIFQAGIGWQIGQGQEYDDEEVQDRLEARALYRLLEKDVAPLFYQRDDQGLPRGWISYMKKNLSVICPAFNSHRMVEDYIDQAYLPSGLRYDLLSSNDFAEARSLGDWVSRLMQGWSDVQVLDVHSPSANPMTWGDDLEVWAKVRLGQLRPEDVACDIYYGRLDAEANFIDRNTLQMEPQNEEEPGVWAFKGSLHCAQTGRIGLRVRVVPHHQGLGSRYSLGLAAWG